MAEVKVEGDIESPLETVWELVGDFIGFMASQGLPATADGEGVGMTRTMLMPDGEIVEKLEGLDAENHVVTYSIVRGSLPVKDYVSTMKLEATGEDSTHLTWSATFEPVGDDPAAVEALLGRVYGGGIKGIKRHLTPG